LARPKLWATATKISTARYRDRDGLPDASKMHLAAIGSVHQKTHVYEFVVEALGRLLVDEANVCLDLDFDSIVGFDCLNSD